MRERRAYGKPRFKLATDETQISAAASLCEARPALMSSSLQAKQPSPFELGCLLIVASALDQ